jgi:ATP-dependent DNA helicase RecG
MEWDAPVEDVAGIGPVSREKLAERGIACAADLVWTLPVAWDDLRAPVGVGEAIERARAAEAEVAPPPRQCVAGVVKSATLVPMRGRRAVRVVLTGEGGATLDAWWFYAAHGILSVAKPGAACIVVGRVRAREGKRPSVAHPDLVADEPAARCIRPRYPALGIAPGIARKAIADALARTTTPLPDPVPEDVARREGMLEAAALLHVVHGVATESPPDTARRALAERLAWVEAFTRVWQRMLSEERWAGTRAPALARDAKVLARVTDALGFELTGAQKAAIEAVSRDLAEPSPMRRLLLGDVGTGKTAVALAAAGQCVAAGWQCALLVPTSVLADQYGDATALLERALGVRAVRIVAGMRAAERREALAAAASGAAGVVVGTHALLEQDVSFARLGLVVVDEQQRLGVAQRLTLVRKGETARPHLLSLSATPIPRTLALALRGELATSTLDERPRGRPPVETSLVARREGKRVMQAMRDACARGERVFVVCPRIEDAEDEEDEALGVESRTEKLTATLAPTPIVSVHGAMRAGDKARAMRAFRSGEASVLVGTTVVEVGVDVPEATLMVVDGAERFGLAQLHQLRGRVGRGDRPGTCLLVHDEPLDDLARRRLETLVRTSDGAEIARADLALRGAGDLGGTRQSGAAEDFEWLDPTSPPAWIDRIEDDARAILGEDPTLTAPSHRALALAARRFATVLAVREEAG